MNIKNYIAIATATVALTVTAFGQWHPEIDKVKTRRPQSQSIKSARDVASGQATGRRKAPSARQDKLGNFEIQDIKSPRDSQTGQATGNQRTSQPKQDKLGNFDIQIFKAERDAASGQATGITSPRDVASGQATGKRQHKPYNALVNNEVIKEAHTKQLQPGNSGGTITNQRSRRPNRR